MGYRLRLGARAADRVDLKDVLGQVEADSDNLHDGCPTG